MPFKITTKKNSLSITFPASLENVDRATGKAANYINATGLDEYAFALLLGMREALNNAVVQGSRRNPLKTVRFELRRETEQVIMQVEDEGEGFDWCHHINRIPTSLEESGRGLVILKRYFEGVEYNAKGNRVTLIKKLNPLHND